MMLATDGGFRNALHAEWTKLRTMAGNAWMIAASVMTTIGLSAAIAAGSRSSNATDLDTTRLSLTGVVLGQALVAVMAALAIGGEYGTGMIRVTFAAMPRRGVVLTAKALVVSAVTLVTGAAAVLGSLLVGRLIFGGADSAHALVSLTEGSTVRAAIGTVLYLGLIALIGLGTGVIIRDPAAAVGVILGLLYLFPLLGAFADDPAWQRWIEKLGPMTAGLAVQNTVNVDDAVIGPWAGLGVLGGWATAALLAGAVVLRARDA